MYPILFQLDGLTIYAYGFFLTLGIVVAGILAILKVRKAGLPISFERVAELFFYAVLSAIVGSRILFVLINFDLYRENPLKIFKIWEGGLVFYGGLILAIGVAIGYMRWYRLPAWKLFDLISPLLALGLFFGRIGCFFAGCCYGKETSLPLGVIFTDPNSLARLNVSLHPTQLYDAANGLAIFLFLIWKEKRKAFDGQIFFFLPPLFDHSFFHRNVERGPEGIHLSRSHLHLSRNRNPVGHNLPFYVILFKEIWIISKKVDKIIRIQGAFQLWNAECGMRNKKIRNLQSEIRIQKNPRIPDYREAGFIKGGIIQRLPFLKGGEEGL